MKKTFLTSILTSAALWIVPCVFAQTGTIREMLGNFELRYAGATEFVPAVVGSEVAQDTVVSTGFRSTAIIEIGSSTLIVRPLTRLSLAEIRYAAGEENVGLNLQAGRVRVDVNPPAGTTASFTVRSATATASVRGTSFEFDVRSVTVLEGSVYFRGVSGVPVMVQAGGESVIGVGGTAGNPAQIVFQNLSPPVPVGAGAAGETVIVPVVLPPNTGNIIIDWNID